MYNISMKTGRPKKNTADKKTEMVAMTVSLVDKQKIENAASKAGLPVSVFLFNCVKQFI